MAYRNSLQADALKLVAKKLQSSLAVEGELPEDGLAAFGDDGDDLMLALARKIVSGDEEDDGRDGGGGLRPGAGTPRPAAEEYLVDDDWRLAEVEAETVAVNGRRSITRPSDRRASSSWAMAAGNGNGGGEPIETQRLLFSWTEFLTGRASEAAGAAAGSPGPLPCPSSSGRSA